MTNPILSVIDDRPARDEPEVALARLNATLTAQDANIDALLDHLSPERETERKASFDAHMAELARLRGELMELLS